MHNLLSALPYLLSLAVTVAIASRRAGARRREGRPIPPASWGWALLGMMGQGALAFWGLMGLIESADPAFAAPVPAVLMAAATLVSLHRDDAWARYDAWDKRARIAARVGLVTAACALAMLAIELPFNTIMPLGGPSFFWLEMLLAGLAMLALYLIGQRRAFACLPAVALFVVAGLGQFFVKRFKNCAILPTDLLVLDTAAAVGPGYVFSLDIHCQLGIACASLLVCALSLARPTGTQERPSARRALANLAEGAGVAALLALVMLVPSYYALLGIEVSYWYSIDSYQQVGFLPAFVTVIQDIPIHRPAGYSAHAAEGLLKDYSDSYRVEESDDQGRLAACAQFEDQRPSVVVVMNESFADLSTFDGMHAGYAGPQFFKTGLSDALVRGTLNVSVFGAGTCNSEFEFLTGNSLGFVGAGKYPYSIYDFSHVDSLACQFRTLGYHTCAIHPNYATNWSRDKVYAQMGFDEFLSIDEFGGIPSLAVDRVTPEEPHCEVFHSGVSDSETYERILRLLDEDDAPQFVFDVTMASHGSFDRNNIPEEYQQHYMPSDYPGEETPERLNEYLACVTRSDDDLREFVGKLRELDRPVVLVFFGDHQPGLSMAYNDYWYPGEPEDAHARRAYRTCYAVWANYDVAGRAQDGLEDEISTDMLAARTLDLVGAPLSDFQAAQLQVRKSIISLSATEYLGEDGTWYAPHADGPYARTYEDLSFMEYLNFATRV